MAIKIISLEDLAKDNQASRPSLQLESEARAIVDRSGAQPNDGVTGDIVREITLVLDQLDRHRELHERLRNNLTTFECYTNTELMHMEMRTPRYSPYRFPEREKFQRRLLNLHQERRRLALDEEQSTQRFHERLLGLVNRHRQIKS